MGCGCFDPQWQNRPPHERRELPGMDERDGLFADVAVETCRACGSTWIHYHFEFEAFSRSGRWYRGLVSAATAADVTAQDAREILERLEWYWAGGSYFGGRIHRASGAIDRSAEVAEEEEPEEKK